MNGTLNPASNLTECMTALSSPYPLAMSYNGESCIYVFEYGGNSTSNISRDFNWTTHFRYMPSAELSKSNHVCISFNYSLIM